MMFNENIATVEGNAIFEETVKMSVQNESMPFIIKSLTDMYSNPLLAMSREYLSNAYDACIASMGTQSSFGTVLDTPIEVTLPSALNPNFIVRDYGIGMDRKVLSTVFPQYGASTKRDNNNEIGGFGLGAKSALALVANFTVVSIKDGKKNTGIVQKGADGVGEISFLPEMETTDPSGTTITITLPKPEALNSVFRDSHLLLGFPHGSILMNGKMHENSVFNPDLYTKIGEDGWVMNSLINWENSQNYRHRNYGFGSSNSKVVVVGPISYKVSQNDLFGDMFDDRKSYNASGKEIFDASTAYSVLNLPIGSVDFTPARENLIFSEKTRKTIIEASKRMSKGVHEFAQASVSEAPSKVEAVRRADMLRMNGFELDWTYKGEKIPVMSTDALRIEGKKVWTSNREAKVTPVPTLLHGERSGNVVVVTGVTDAEQAKVLNRLRKPFADRYNPQRVNASTLSILYMEAEKSELSAWAEALVMELFTVEEWEAKGVAFRKEINDERKAKRAASASTGLINYGSTPVGVLSPRHGYSNDRPKVHSSYASDISTAGVVIYMRLNADAPETMSHKFAQTMMADKDAPLTVRDLNDAINALISHYTQAEKTVRIVRIPANTKVETFLKAVPHAISMDEAVKAVADTISEDKESALELLMAQKTHRYKYLRVMAQSVELIENEEARAFYAEAYKAYSKADSYRTSAVISAKSRFLFADSFENLFADVRKSVKASNKFPLPLLEDVGNMGFRTDSAIQYINLMYPAAA